MTGISIEYNLQFFAKDGPGGEKTEEPTAKKLRDARNKGQVAKSMELVTACMLLMLFLALKFFVGWIGNNFLGNYADFYGMISQYGKNGFTENVALSAVNEGLGRVLTSGFPVYIAAFLIAFLVNIFQVKWVVSREPLKPKLNKFNPISGFKRLFSKDKLMELLKSLLKIGVISYVVYDTLKDKWPIIYNLYGISLFQAVYLIGQTVIDLGIKISIFFLAIGILDWVYQKRKFHKDMMMTKQEVKDEYKNAEGDPQIKGKIRRRMQQASRRRMMQKLPEADVVITNPTHLAVAIKYDKEIADAPIVLAKGEDYLAQKIKEAAASYAIEIVENKPLARMLYYNVEIGQVIPPELYQMTAEVLAYVYNLKKEKEAVR